jgi:hypothetical protein
MLYIAIEWITVGCGYDLLGLYLLQLHILGI